MYANAAYGIEDAQQENIVNRKLVDAEELWTNISEKGKVPAFSICI